MYVVFKMLGKKEMRAKQKGGQAEVHPQEFARSCQHSSVHRRLYSSARKATRASGCCLLQGQVLSVAWQAGLLAQQDSVIPFIWVAIQSVLNVVGDLALIMGLQQGLAGAAWATVLSQLVGTVGLVSMFRFRGQVSAGKACCTMCPVLSARLKPTGDAWQRCVSIVSVCCACIFVLWTAHSCVVHV